ncbi:hypothetical protein HSBAA_22430 [Vreelandella sulfidaeris]|uniref:Uncharacterized protein n=1 Tax=Vreelandella sulfidaeris TaxID=115553 RepID=A0A455U5Z0_9GAMM|nr:hypothetical protein HSBAA_22430 [Halomonas sulfidaeris]
MGVSLLDAAKQLQPAGAVYHNMSEADMQQVLTHPLSMVGSDGLPNDPHPTRAFGEPFRACWPTTAAI